MKQFDFWYLKYKRPYIYSDVSLCKDAFKAGMLAAADIVNSWRYSVTGEAKLVGLTKGAYHMKLGRIEDEIRNACKDEG